MEEEPELEPALLQSTSAVAHLLEERFARMKLKEKAIKICPVSSTDDTVDNFDAIRFIDSSLVMGQLQQENLKDAEDLIKGFHEGALPLKSLPFSSEEVCKGIPPTLQ